MAKRNPILNEWKFTRQIGSLRIVVRASYIASQELWGIVVSVNRDIVDLLQSDNPVQDALKQVEIHAQLNHE